MLLNIVIYLVGNEKYHFISLVLDDPVITKLATRIGCTSAQVCIGYALAKGLAVVTKTEKESRMKENLASIEIAKQLSEDDVSLIDTLDRNLRKFWDVYDIE